MKTARKVQSFVNHHRLQVTDPSLSMSLYLRIFFYAFVYMRYILLRVIEYVSFVFLFQSLISQLSQWLRKVVRCCPPISLTKATIDLDSRTITIPLPVRNVRRIRNRILASSLRRAPMECLLSTRILSSCNWKVD